MPHNTVNRLNLRHLLSKNVNVNYPEAYGRICRCYHSHSDGTEFELHPNTFNSPEKTRKFVKKLRSKQRALLLTEIQTLNQELNQDDQNMLLPPSRAQLRLVALNNAVPFVGFGFLDNAIMIIAGDYIDWRLGALFGISTLAAAGLGNLISDLAGVVLAGYVEAFAAKFGIPSPNLSLEQYDMRGSKIASALGRCIGIALGCLLGMFPLFFLKTESKEETDSPEEHQE
ncbi:putative transmembrane protein [Apostichopus japonicus]|uniref:Putative transmembrane protein n=1 Tax=Stichopus japonicus TaxID=307972 RepID=A0A2G8JKS7_STIJA|nr:putative transmembrane protein [Apostichopus japonicus]